MTPLKKKGLVASIAALAMAVGGLGIGAGVANAATESTITLTGTTTGHTYDFYQIGKYAAISDSSVSVVKVSDTASDLVKAAAPADADTGNDGVSWAASLASGSAELRELVGKLEQNSTDDLKAALGEPTSVKDKATEVTVPDEGWYLVVDTAADGTTHGVGALVGTTSGSVTTITAEDGSTYELGKVDLKPDTDDNGNPNADPKKTFEGSLAADGTAIFTLTANGPQFSSSIKYSSYEYSFTDTPTAITPDTSTLVVKVGDDTLTKDTDYELVEGANGAFTVKLDKYFTALVTADGFSSADESGKLVTVTYTGKVASKDDGGDDAKNVFTINDNGHEIPGEGTTDETPGVANMSFKKVGLDNTTGLAGAVFDLYPTVDDPDTQVDDTTVAVATATSDDKGVVNFTKIGTGTYKIVETTAPTGYITAPGVTFTVAVNTFKDADATNDTVEFVSDATDMVTLGSTNKTAGTSANADGTNASLKNVQSLAQLPLTGAYGIALFLIVAVVLGGAAAVMVVVSKHNKKAALAA